MKACIVLAFNTQLTRSEVKLEVFVLVLLSKNAYHEPYFC